MLLSNRLTAKSSLFVALTLFACSCGAPKKAAYINIDLALARSIHFQVDRPQVALSEAIAPDSVSNTMPQLQAITIAKTDAGERLAQARKDIEKQRLDSIELLSKQVFESFVRDIEKYRLKTNEGIEAKLREKLEVSADLISSVLRKYAESRWKPANRLALLVGYPFPAQQSPALPEESKIETARREEIQKLSAQLTELEIQYQADVQTLFGEIFSVAAQSRLELGLEVVNRLDQADLQAHTEARKAIESVNDEVLVLLITQGQVQIPALASSNVRIERTKVVEPSIHSTKEIAQAIISEREELQADLKIWLGIHAKVLSPSPRLANDETENFIEWRKRMKNGH